MNKITKITVIALAILAVVIFVIFYFVNQNGEDELYEEIILYDMIIHQEME